MVVKPGWSQAIQPVSAPRTALDRPTDGHSMRYHLVSLDGAPEQAGKHVTDRCAKHDPHQQTGTIDRYHASSTIYIYVIGIATV